MIGISVIRVFEAFSGVGAQRMALRNIGVEHEVVGISEIDKFAIQSYEAIHGKTLNFGDISKINPNELPDFDLFTYSFPCQDLSTAGKQQGMIKRQTRSGLLYECEKIIEVKRPKYLLLENVKNLVGKKFKLAFEEWLVYLESLGYTNHWQVLNAKDFNIPQNRERVFVVSILEEHDKYIFPLEKILEKRIKDILEDRVDDKYYLTEEVTERLKPNKYVFPIKNGFIEYKGNEVELPCICASRGRNPDNPSVRAPGVPTEQRLEVNCKGVSNTLTTIQKDNYVIETNCRFRKLTPKECWRLMGFKDEDFYKAKESGVSDSQLYKQAGNSIVVPVLERIFSELIK